MEKLYIVKIGGNVIDNNEKLHLFLKNFTLLKEKKILIHGGGKIATQVADKLGLEVKMHNGRRITDQAMLEVVQMVYGGLVNKNIVSMLQALGCNAVGLTGADLNVVRAVKRPVKDIDYGFVGDVTQVNQKALSDLLENDCVPILAPLTHDGKGNMLNTNADTIASETATAMSSAYQTHLLYCFEKKGVLKDVNDESSVITSLNEKNYAEYLAQNVIFAGMIPKLDNAFSALKKGVREVVILEADNLQNIENQYFIGTRITLQ
ncbi:acetylglutamate kinase [Thermoflexibacter ruber]|uniref:acetylglutamate kinase n=1 Tax=Thermoflexibacter ruber TaxID=1003 RepID=UPI000AF2EBA2|nr:acetylglutamate kinase [Thermoflexibacter ruber]